MLSHKWVLISVRMTLCGLVAALAIEAWLEGGLSPVLPANLAFYLFTNLAMLLEGPDLPRPRVQAFLFLFDLAVLGLSLYYLQEDRQELFLAMFLVVLLASASQRLEMALTGFAAVAICYVWFSAGSDLGRIFSRGDLSRITVLLVVALYVGFLSETAARERDRRQAAEARLRRELKGMERTFRLASTVAAELEPERFFGPLLETTRTFLEPACVGVLWRRQGTEEFTGEGGPRFPQDLLTRWKGLSGGRSPVHAAIRGDVLLRLTESSGGPGFPDWMGAATAHGLDETVVAPFIVATAGLEGGLIVGWTPPHDHQPVEEEALRALACQTSLCLDNVALRDMLARARDAWQAAFQSVPVPVLIADQERRLVQANPAFWGLCRADPASVGPAFFREMMAEATLQDGRSAGSAVLADPGYAPLELRIPRLGGTFQVTRGPYRPEESSGGEVWVLRALPGGVSA